MEVNFYSNGGLFLPWTTIEDGYYIERVNERFEN